MASDSLQVFGLVAQKGAFSVLMERVFGVRIGPEEPLLPSLEEVLGARIGRSVLRFTVDILGSVGIRVDRIEMHQGFVSIHGRIVRMRNREYPEADGSNVQIFYSPDSEGSKGELKFI